MRTETVTYLVSRTLNRFNDRDYLIEWDNKYGTSCSAIKRSMRFETETKAVEAMVRAQQVVPTWVGCGTAIDWHVVVIEPDGAMVTERRLGAEERTYLLGHKAAEWFSDTTLLPKAA